MNRPTPMLAIGALALSGCAGHIAGIYRANFNQPLELEFASGHEVILNDAGVEYAGRYEENGHWVKIQLSRPWINGQREQTFEKSRGTLTARPGPSDLFLPGGSQFTRTE